MIFNILSKDSIRKQNSKNYEAIVNLGETRSLKLGLLRNSIVEICNAFQDSLFDYLKEATCEFV